MSEKINSAPYTLDTAKCAGCGSCYYACAVGAIREEDGHFVITGDCVGCGSCRFICPVGAITAVKDN